MDLDQNKGDGSDNFWPGYVDAVTNLVLNLLFLLTIMTVAVFMFALELGRASLGGTGKTMAADTKSAVATPQTVSADPVKEREVAVAALRKELESLDRDAPKDPAALRKRVEAIESALKRELQFLSMMRVQQAGQKAQGAPVTVVPATAGVAKPKKELDKTLATQAEVIVRFTDEAVTLTKGEYARLQEALKPIVANGSARIYTEVPAGFSEAKRMGYYRSMAVRNLLIEMKMPQNRIDVLVREGKSSANASLVRVMSP